MAVNLKIRKDCLGYLGDKVQKQIVKLMIEDTKWLSIYLNDIKKEEKFFTEKYLDDIISIVKKKFEDKGVTPTYNEIYTGMKVLYSTEQDYQSILELLKELKGDSLYEGIDVAETTGIEALRKAEALYILENAKSKIYSTKNIDTALGEVNTKIFEILNPVQTVEVGGFAVENQKALEEDKPAQRIPTDITELDEQLRGGIAKKRVALLIAGTGVGKTTLGSMICAGAALSGFKVLHIIFEDETKDIYRMYMATYTGENIAEIYGQKSKNIFESLNENAKNALSNNIITYQMSNGETTVEMIRDKIKRIMNDKGWKPDMVFIDYLSCLLPTENKIFNMSNEWTAWERCMKKIEVLAKEMDIAVWVSQQTNRDGMKMDSKNNRMANMQGSYRAVQPASYVLYLDKIGCEKGRANLYLDKCRGCETKEWIGVPFNNGTCQIDLSDTMPINFNEMEYNENETFKMYS